MSNVTKKISTNSLSFKIICTVVASILCLSIALTTLTIQISQKAFINNYSNSQSKLLSQIELNLTEFNQEIFNLMNSSSSHWAVKLYLTNPKMPSDFEFQTIYHMRKYMDEITPAKDFSDVSVLLLGLNGKSYLNHSDQITTPKEQILADEVTQNALSFPDIVHYQYIDYGFTRATAGDSAIVISKALITLNEKTPYGIIHIMIPEKVFQKFYNYFSYNNCDVIVTNDKKQIISSNIKSLLGQDCARLNYLAKEIQENKLIYKTVHENKKSHTILSQKIPFYNFNMNVIMDSNKVLRELYDITPILLLCFIITICIIAVLFLMIRQTTKPLSLLVQKMSNVKNGDFNHYAKIHGTDEIRELSQTFNYMLDDMNTYIHELITVQKDKRQAEIHALQMQINPHYIYNTLSSIKWLIWQDNKEKAVTAIDAFISLLQNTISNTEEFITVSEEIENLKNYVFINNTRYGDNIHVEYYISPDCTDCLIPKLLLQPFIENAFFHAFNNRNLGSIQVCIAKQSEHLLCEIIDNGIGMNPFQLDDVIKNQPHKSDHFSGIGIHNVDSRIKLLYGNQYGIKITSEQGIGTTVRITLPRNNTPEQPD